MKKETFKLILAQFEELGINPTKWFGTRTNVKRIGERNLSAVPLNEAAIKNEFENQGVDRILKLFDEEARYLPQLNDMEATQLLANLKVANKIINPPPKPEADVHMFSKLPGKKLTPDEYSGKKEADEGKIMSAQLHAAMETNKVDQDLAKKLNLDMSKISDFNKLQAWKKKHNVPDFYSPEGLASLFKTVSDNPLADLGTQLDNIKKEGKSMADEAKKLVDMAWRMSPEGQAKDELIRKDINRRSNEGKGFAGGVFGPRNDGFFRAVVRPFLLDQHDKGIIKLADNTLESLKNADDLKGGGDFMSADPVRVFRQHYGDDAFDLIPDQEAFGMGPTGYGPTTNERVSVLEKVIKEPIMKKGPDNPGGYLTKGEYQAKIDHQDEVLGYMNRDEGRFGALKPDELAEEMMATEKTKKNLIKTMNELYPSTGTTDLPPKKVWSKDEIKAQADETLDKKLEGTGVTREGFVNPFNMTKPSTPMKPTKLSLNIRLMKNFNQPLDDAGLAKEGYNVQEIDVLKKARNRMTSGEEMHPNEALLREKELLADEAGIDVEDLDDLKLEIDWGDMTPEPLAQGGRVGYRYGTGEEGVQSFLVDQMQEIEGQTAGPEGYHRILEEQMNLLAEELDKHPSDLSDSEYELAGNRAMALWRSGGFAQGGGVGSMFRRV